MARKPSKIKQSRAVKEAVQFLKTKKSWRKTDMAVRGIIYSYNSGQFQLTPIGRAAFDVLDDEVDGGKQ